MKLIERVKQLGAKREMILVEADKGYDSAELRQELLNRGFFPDPMEKNVKEALICSALYLLLNHANVLSTTQRLAATANPATLFEVLLC